MSKPIINPPKIHLWTLWENVAFDKAAICGGLLQHAKHPWVPGRYDERSVELLWSLSWKENRPDPFDVINPNNHGLVVKHGFMWFISISFRGVLNNLTYYSLNFWWVHHGVCFRCIGRHHRNITTHVRHKLIQNWTWESINYDFTWVEWTLSMIFVSHCRGLRCTKQALGVLG